MCVLRIRLASNWNVRRGLRNLANQGSIHHSGSKWSYHLRNLPRAPFSRYPSPATSLAFHGSSSMARSRSALGAYEGAGIGTNGRRNDSER